MAYSIKQANEYIAANIGGVNGKFRPMYHMTPPIGWMNDPNGLVYFRGEYRLFYQFNPYALEPQSMHWGQFASKDLISYGNASVALAPTEKDETDCFSGGAVVAGGGMNIVYTRHYEIKDVKTEKVCLVRSSDGVTFSKKSHAVFDNESLPKNISRSDFRDPFPFKVGDKFYVFVGAKDVHKNQGLIVVLCGNALDKLEYDFTIGPFYELGEMAECPCYCRVGGKDVIAVSGVHVGERGNDYKNTHSSAFIVGELDFERKSMKVEFVKEIDKGDAFYAPQFVNNADMPIMIAWQEMWNKPYPTRDKDHGWVGSFSIPRVLSMEGGAVVQKPIAAIENYESDWNGDTLPKTADITAVIGKGGELIIQGDNGQVVIGNDGRVYLDTVNSNNANGCIRRTDCEYNVVKVRILLDVSCIEVFVDDGKEAISSRMYIDGDFSLIAEGNVKNISIKHIGVPV